jgi:hypothetical protein
MVDDKGFMGYGPPYFYIGEPLINVLQGLSLVGYPRVEAILTASIISHWICETSRLDHRFELVKLVFCYRVGVLFRVANGPTSIGPRHYNTEKKKTQVTLPRC